MNVKGILPPTAPGLPRRSLSRAVTSALGLLSEREETVLRLSFGVGGRALDLELVARMVGVTPLGARRLQRRALEKLRSYSHLAPAPSPPRSSRGAATPNHNRQGALS